MNKISLIEAKNPHWKGLWFQITGWYHTSSDASCPMRAAHLGTHLRKTPHVRPVPQRTGFAPAHGACGVLVLEAYRVESGRQWDGFYERLLRG
ncbi:MAG: hypothetical protein GYB49_17520 [Alphaproteobacteria bacterium]|nr:hypothetical protein [Alphaproteobacteria bacterium]|tara:strand:+ start:376 stop:654 length:279 start_codon:yes stop_codon:yes gene_type:complete